jgi:hypothetical protein
MEDGDGEPWGLSPTAWDSGSAAVGDVLGAWHRADGRRYGDDPSASSLRLPAKPLLLRRRLHKPQLGAHGAVRLGGRV